MDLMNEKRALVEDELPGPKNGYLQKFRLYETRSNFYMIGRNKSRTCWRVLKIDRLEPSELNVLEDSTAYSENECCDLLKRIHEGNMPTGGLKFVTTCYGIFSRALLVSELRPTYHNKRWGTKDTSMDMPVNLEARRRVSFFATFLFMDMPTPPKVRNMMSFSVHSERDDVLPQSDKVTSISRDGGR